MSHEHTFPWAARLFPERLKSPWWIGHIPFAFELIGRMQPRTVVELGTYSGSSFAAFCQAVEASGGNGHVYGVDLWQGDVHMGSFDEELYQEMAAFASTRFPNIATLIRKDFNEAASSFADGSVDLLHIDGTHTFEAVINDFETWLPKMSDRGVILFHDINVTEQNAGPAALKFGVRRVFDSLKANYSSAEFDHCFGLGVLVVGRTPDASVIRLLDEVKSEEAKGFFAEKGGAVSKHFESLGIALPQHGSYGASSENNQGESSPTTVQDEIAPVLEPVPAQIAVPRPSILRRALNKLRRMVA